MKAIIYTVKDPATQKDITGTARQLCEHFDLPLSTVQSRIYSRKWPPQRAFTEKKPPEEQQTVKLADGTEITGTLNELCDRFKIKRHTVKSRMRLYNMDLVTALTRPSQYENFITVTDPDTGKSYTDTKAGLMRRFDASTNTIRYRMKSGMTFEQALFLKKPNARRPRPTGLFEVRDPVTKQTITGTYHELIKHFNAVEGTVFYRMCNGMPFELAVTLPTNYTRKQG